MAISANRRIYIYTALLAGALLVMTPSHADQPLQLSFGLYASDKPTSLVKKFRPILNALQQDLSKRLGKPVKIKLSIAKSYDEGIDQLVSGKVDFTRMGPASYIIAHNQNPGIRLIAMETKKGKTEFNGVICVHKDSGITSVKQLSKKSFAFGDENSTIGRYLSQQYLLQHGITSRALKEFVYLGRHDKVGYAVAKHQYDAGALKESTYKKLVKKGMQLRKIASFKNVTKPWVARKGMDEKIYLALRSALLSLKDKKVLSAIKKDGFVAAAPENYASIKKAMDNNKRFFK